LLAYLIENAGRVLTKDELMENVWVDTFVEEANLTQHISNLRRVLGKDLIETIPRKGYRFVADVNAEKANDPVEVVVEDHRVKLQTDPATLEAQIRPASNPEEEPPHPSKRTFSYLKVFAILALIAGIGLASAYYRYWQPRSNIGSIAVLPFKTLASDENDAYLKFGMADSLITKLSSLKKIIVRPTSSILKFTDANQDSVAAGKELNVDAVLEGAVQKDKERFRVSIQLIRTSDGSIIWAEVITESSASELNLQDSIAEKIVNKLALDLTGEERQALAKRHTENEEAYQLYIQGRFFWYKWSPEGFQKAIGYFQKAIEKDPKYALAYAGLGDAYGALGLMSAPKENYLRSKEATLKALELDDSLAEAHMVLGMIKMFYEWDRPAAREQFLIALRLDPDNALVHDTYSIYLMTEGRLEEAIFHSKRALELDPLSTYMIDDLGITYFYSRQYDAALEHLNKAIEQDPNYVDALEYLAEVYLVKGDQAKAIGAWEKILTITGKPQAAQSLAQTFAASGYKAAVTKRIEQLTQRAKQSYVSPMEFANNYARLGDKRQAIDWLKRAYDEKSPSLVRIKIEPRWDDYRSSAEFEELIDKIYLRN
jgi:TolB-like protein/DNA-binding SARP family transcriptional activator